MLKYEIIKQLRTPFVWLFAAACVLINALSVISQDYDIRQILREGTPMAAPTPKPSK